MDERLASSARNARELRQLKALEKIAENVGLIAQVLMLNPDLVRPDTAKVRNGVGEVVAAYPVHGMKEEEE